jgi:hypothetical protein
LALGIWGGLVPFIGHYFHFALGPDKSWTWTSGRLYLDVLPAAVAVLGGLMLLGAGPRPSARLGALLAIAAGIWFAIGPDVSHLWNASGAQGAAHGSRTIRTLEMLAYHTALGALLAALGGYALPRFVRAREVVAEPGTMSGRRTAAASATAAAATTAHAPAGRWEPSASGAPAETDVREERAAETAVHPRDEYAAEPAAAAGAAPAADARDAETVDTRGAEPAAARDAGPVGADEADPGRAPAADRRGAYGDQPTTELGGQYAGAPASERGSQTTEAPTADGGAGRSSAPAAMDGQDANSTHTVRRRRGGLLCSLF